MDGSDRGLIECNMPTIVWRDWGRPRRNVVTGPRINAGISPSNAKVRSNKFVIVALRMLTDS
jgi:hypothetical protein